MQSNFDGLAYLLLLFCGNCCLCMLKEKEKHQLLTTEKSVKRFPPSPVGRRDAARAHPVDIRTRIFNPFRAYTMMIHPRTAVSPHPLACSGSLPRCACPRCRCSLQNESRHKGSPSRPALARRSVRTKSWHCASMDFRYFPATEASNRLVATMSDQRRQRSASLSRAGPLTGTQ
jgi:hypothetical protein